MSLTIEDDTEPIDLTDDRLGEVEEPHVEIDPAEVLVVDDEPANLRALEAALEGLSTRIISVTSGTDALREVLLRNIALILLDVHMPTTTGFEIARVIRSRERSRHIPIIFFTAHSHSEVDIRRGYELGAVDYLFKPVVPEVLRAKVQAFVELRNRTAQVQAQAARLRELERADSQRRLEEAKRVWRADLLRRQMEEQRRINARLEEDDRRKDEFLAVLAHELRNPLTPIVTGLALLHQTVGGSPVVDRTCATISRQVKHLVRLVDDLLDVSRITRGKVTLRRKPIDVRDCIAQAVETCSTAIEAAGHTLHVRLPDTPLRSEADLDRLTQVVNNLLSNAVRYTDPGGDITVEAREDGDELVIWVRDTGRGIPPEMLQRVFEMFVQERNEGKGLGLGLTLVQQVVQMHDGSVQAHSAGRGQGSEFEVRLPRLVDAGDVVTTPVSDPPPSEALPPLRVLVVDDEADVAVTTRDLLHSWGHEVHVANCGRDGVVLAHAVSPDLILLDIGLPDLDGYHVAAEIRRDDDVKRPYLVAVTGFGQPRDKERATNAGFDDHIVKPAPPHRLREALRACAQMSTT